MVLGISNINYAINRSRNLVTTIYLNIVVTRFLDYSVSDSVFIYLVRNVLAENTIVLDSTYEIIHLFSTLPLTYGTILRSAHR